MVLPVVGSVTRLTTIFLVVCYFFALTRGRIALRRDAIYVLGATFVLLAVASALWSSHFDLGALSTLVQLGLLGLVVSAIVQEAPKAVSVILVSLGAGAVGAAALGLARFLGEGTGEGGPARVSALDTQGVEHFAAYLLPGTLFFLLWALRKNVSTPLRILLAVSSILTVSALLASGTRSAWMGLAGALVLVVVPRLSRRQTALLAAFALACLIVTISIPGLGDFVLHRADVSLETGGAGRLDIWRTGLGLVENSPIVGSGYATFDDRFSPQTILDSTFSGSALPGLNRAPHSIYLGLIVELGAAGLVLFGLWMMWLIIQTRGGGTLTLVTRASLVAYLIQGAYLDILNRKYFWLIIGLAEGCSRLLQRQRGKVSQ